MHLAADRYQFQIRNDVVFRYCQFFQDLFIVIFDKFRCCFFDRFFFIIRNRNVIICQRTFDRGGNVVIPSFAVGRTQEMLYFIRKIKAAFSLRRLVALLLISSGVTIIFI